jgi:ribosomal protein L37AE/L43A
MKRERQLHSDYTTLKVSKRNHDLKRRAVEYKGGCCQVCGYSRFLGALEFHHTDPSQKDWTVARNHRAWEVLKVELDKCILLCSNCHREEHGKITQEKHAGLEQKVREIIPVRQANPKVPHVCKTCKRTFLARPQIGQTFCSKKCRETVAWPSADILRDMVQTLKPSQIASKFGCHPRTVREKLHKLGISWK